MDASQQQAHSELQGRKRLPAQAQDCYLLAMQAGVP